MTEIQSRPSAKDVVSYSCTTPIYALGVSEREDQKFRVAIGSFVEAETNSLDVISFHPHTRRVVQKTSIRQQFPASKVMFLPSNVNRNPDLIATTADYLRLFRSTTDDQFSLQTLLDHNKAGEFSAPLTSFDWCRTNLASIVTSSIDCTCTVWDIKRSTIVAQVVAHESEVFDVCFSLVNRSIFASCSKDRSLRYFDLRSLESSTILYESPSPIVRLAWNKQNETYIALLSMDSSYVELLDIRLPTHPVAKLTGSLTDSCINAIDWAPHSPHHLVTAGDDAQVLVWDTNTALLQPMEPGVGADPMLGYSANQEVNSVRWSHRATDWVVIGMEKEIQMLRV